MQKWIFEFLRKFENRGIKFARVDYILITKSINLQIFTLILCGVGGVRYDINIFELTAPVLRSLTEKSMHHCINASMRDLCIV